MALAFMWGTRDPDPTVAPKFAAMTDAVTDPIVSPHPIKATSQNTRQKTSQSARPADPTSKLRLDVVRVDATGSTVVAGRAEVGHTVSIFGDGQELGSTIVGADGSFVAFLDIPRSVDPTVLTLSSKETPDEIADPAPVVTSKDTFLVMPQPENSSAAPLVVAAKQGNVQVTSPLPKANSAPVKPIPEPASEPAAKPKVKTVNPEPVPAPEPDPKTKEPGPAGIASITLDTIDYAKDGDVVLSGRGRDARDVRVYVDNQPVELGTIQDGRWRLSLPDVDEGIYTLRVDALDDQGDVVSRVESPFKRETPDLETLTDRVTIQPGFTLWQLAAEKYGSGGRYVQIFDANQDTIKDPNLIYPGQVFTMPKD